MKNKPIIHKYHFNDMREPILEKLETILQNDQILSLDKNTGYKFINISIKPANTTIDCVVVLINDNVVIHTSNPDQPNIHNRLWMISNFLGQITYIEIENPNLRSAFKYDPTNPSGNAFEMHAMPQDLQYLDNLLQALINLVSNIKIHTNTPIDNRILKYLS